MERLDNYVWYCCQDPIPFFRLRILKILSIILGIGLFIVILPVIGIINFPLSCNHEILMTSGQCYANGIIIVAIAAVVGYGLFICFSVVAIIVIKPIQEHGLKGYCFESCGHVPYWAIYIFILICVGIFGIGIPYGITLAITGTTGWSVWFLISLLLELIGLIAFALICVLIYAMVKCLTDYDSEIEERRKLSLDPKSNIQYDSENLDIQYDSENLDIECDSVRSDTEDVSPVDIN